MRGRRDGASLRFLGGTDDYSLKNVIAAEDAGVAVRDFVDSHARGFEDLQGPLALSFDDFIRTSADGRHVPAVHHLWKAALANGDLHKQPYEGDYCVGCSGSTHPTGSTAGGAPNTSARSSEWPRRTGSSACRATGTVSNP